MATRPDRSEMMSTATEHWSTHWDAGHNWALVLAAGEGSRLQVLTPRLPVSPYQSSSVRWAAVHRCCMMR